EGRPQCSRRAAPRGHPRPDAARARHELADRLPQVPGLERVLVAAVRVALDEWLPHEARHLVAADRARGFERRRGEHGQIERVVLAWITVEQVCERARGGDPADERAHDPGVGAVGAAGRLDGHAGYPVPGVPPLKTSSSYVPTGDQPAAIELLSDGLRAGERYQTLLGATGTGKTATM